MVRIPTLKCLMTQRNKKGQSLKRRKKTKEKKKTILKHFKILVNLRFIIKIQREPGLTFLKYMKWKQSDPGQPLSFKFDFRLNTINISKGVGEDLPLR